MRKNLGQMLRFCKLEFLLTMLVLLYVQVVDPLEKKRKENNNFLLNFICAWASFCALYFDSPQASLMFHIVCAHFN